MITNEATRSSTEANVKTQSHAKSFAKVLDGRKHPVRGLWVRNGRFYAQLAIEDANTGVKKVRRVPLLNSDAEPVQTAPQAIAEINRLRTQRADDDLPAIGRTPKFSAYADDYLAFIKSGAGTKKPGTISKEKSTLARWKEHLGDMRLDKIKPVHVSAFMRKRLQAKRSKRTVKLDIIALRNVLKRARDIDQHIRTLPIPPGLNGELKSATPKRPLFTHEALERLCEAAFATKTNEAGKDAPVTKNAREFVDYVRLLAYSGARRNEGLALRWDDVDFEREQLTIGATGDTKKQTARVVDFNPKLKSHLQEMMQRRANESQWIFPSPQRGDKDIHAQSFRESLSLARAKAGLPKVGFHDLRHYFISYCVMSGIDFMTIAKWVGHRDGGILIGKVYGHLADDHAKAQAQRVNFGPVVLAKAANQ
jgi:integrase